MATIASPLKTKLYKRLESICRKALFDYEMIEDKSPIGVALSGGKDSLTLLYLLSQISGAGFPKFPIHALHVSGSFSCGPGITGPFLKDFCDELGVSFHSVHTEQKLETLECYSCSRKRRTLLFNLAKENGIETIAFGHHKDDSVETLLMNVLHKSEFEPLSPKLFMRRYDCTIIRPMVLIEEALIDRFAEASGFKRLMCLCPVGTHSMRQKTKKLIETIEKLYPNAKSNLAKAGLSYSKKLFGDYGK